MNPASYRRVAILAATMALAACTTAPKKEPPSPVPPEAKYYKDDGPGESPPAGLETMPDAIPRVEPLHRFANRPYTVFGREYVPATTLRPYKERGIASWYGRKFHGEKTSTGELYDMYAMTAAHPTLPLPSYARVTNTATGKTVIVRVNDRGPFLHNRVVDLSFAAATKIGIAQKGSGEVEVEAIIPIESPGVIVAGPLPPVAVPPPAATTIATPQASPAVAVPPPVAVTAATQQAAPPLAAPASTRPAVEASVPVTATDTGFVVQLGAFASNANAESFLAHVAGSFAQIGVQPRIRQVGGLFRVFLGPYASREDAKRTADRVRDAIGLDSLIAVH